MSLVTVLKFESNSETGQVVKGMVRLEGLISDQPMLVCFETLSALVSSVSCLLVS